MTRRPTWADDQRTQRPSLEAVETSRPDEIATIRLAGTELDRSRRYARIAAATPPMGLGWVAVLTTHLGNLTDALIAGDDSGAVMAVRQMQADLEACKNDMLGADR